MSKEKFTIEHTKLQASWVPVGRRLHLELGQSYPNIDKGIRV